MIRILPCLRQRSVVPDVAVAGERVGDEPKPSTLLIEVLKFYLGQLYSGKRPQVPFIAKILVWELF